MKLHIRLRIRLSLLAPALLLCFAAPRAAQAQLTLTLTSAAQTGPASGAFHFAGTLTNSTAAEVFLNGDSPTFNGPGTIDDSAFLNNAPVSLGPAGGGSDTYTGSFFDIILPSSAAPGTYFGTCTVLGGPTANDLMTVGTEDFLVTVSPSPAVPEASTTVSLGLLLALGLGGLVVAARRKNSASLL